MRLQRIEITSTYPVTVDELKDWLRWSGDDLDDTLITAIHAATEAAESFLGLSLVESNWKLHLDGFEPAIRLPRGPVMTVESLSYLGRDMVERTFTDYLERGDFLIPTDDWPYAADIPEAVAIEYQAGLTTTSEAIRVAIMMLAQSKVDALADQPAMLVQRSYDLLRPYRERQLVA